ANSCNVLYVMWRLEPTPDLVVALKSNPGQQINAECSDRGYTTLRPQATGPLPAIATAEPHVLHAALLDGTLTVRADGAEGWRGGGPPEASALVGPVGLRTDNGRFALDLWAPAGATDADRCPRGEPD